MIRHSLFFLFIFLAVSGFAQKPVDLKKAAEKHYANGRWAEALTALEQYQAVKPGDIGVLTKLGIVHYRLHQPDKARKYLDYLLTQNPQSKDPDLHYYLARTLHGQQEWVRAIAAYKSYLRAAGERHPYRANAADNIRRCLSGMTLRSNDGVALVENLGDRVNTVGDEFAPVPSVNHADRLYFSAAREGCTGGRRNDAGYDDPEAGHWCSDMFISQQSTGGWEPATVLNGLLNTSRFEVAMGFNAIGQVLYYFRGFTLYSGEVLVDTAGRKDEYSLMPPPFVSPMRPEQGDCHAFFFNDSTLIFASRQAGGQGGLDLYVTRLRDSLWTMPQNLGPAVNSPYDETTPFLARDGRTLFFSSNHTGGMGGLDIYKAVFDDKKRAWQTPENLGMPVNSPDDDAFFRLSNDGRTAYFSSDRLDSRGERDLYQVYFKEEQSEQTRVSTPATFASVAALAAAETENRPVYIPALFYDSDRDVLSADNLKAVNEAAALARRFPTATMLVTANTDETGPSKFDLYYGIKRAEMVGKALTDRGVTYNRVVLRSVGSAYPIARNVLDAAPNPVGQKLNRRLEITLALPGESLPTEVLVQRPSVSELMASGAFRAFEEATAGLSYKVEMATTRQILNNDSQAMFGDLMIESQPGAGTYRYTAGLFKQHAAAAQLRKELQAQGFADATVVAYLNGIRIQRAEAVGLMKKWPDLAGYVRG